MGDFIATAAAQAAGLNVIRLAETLGADAARCAPAAAVALLFEREMSGGPDKVRLTDAQPATGGPNAGSRTNAGPAAGGPDKVRPTGEAPHNVACGFSRKNGRSSAIDAVVKFGGGVLADSTSFQEALAAVQQLAARLHVVIVPGGGPFADAVRDVDRRLALPPATSHWMAVQAMDQYAELLVARLSGAVRVDSPEAIDEALDRGQVPVLAPARWLRSVDPMPHSWNVTSDSIAAWISGALDARLLLLVKPAGARGDVVDPFFADALPAGVTPVIVPAEQAAGMLPEV
jgi:aspartokinase-like uncharacterized kinase